jgi:hypothetical protein
MFGSVVFVNRLDSGGLFEATPRTTGTVDGKSPVKFVLFKTYYRLRLRIDVRILNRSTTVVLIDAECG